jgi:hemolysin D
LAGARASVDEKTQALGAARATLEKYRETTEIAQEREFSARPLVDSGAISRADLDQKVTNEAALKGDLDKTKQLYALKWLRAPVDGLVQKVDVTTIGEVVTPAQSLVTIVPDDTPLIVEASVSNEDIGYLKVGQPVEVKVDTFPFQKYGSLEGTLVSISPDAEEKSAASRDMQTRSGVGAAAARQETSSESANAGYVYKVLVRTKQSAFRIGGEQRAIQPGMTVQADIVTDRRRVIEFFLSPVTKYMAEGLRVR